MATKAKIERERQALIEKYGDVILIKIIDYYYPTFVIEGSDHEEDTVVATVRLSQVQIDNTADLNEVKRRLQEGEPVKRKWKFPESEKKYNSPQEVERREKMHRTYPPLIVKPNQGNTGEQSAPGSQDSRPAESPEEESTES